MAFRFLLSVLQEQQQQPQQLRQRLLSDPELRNGLRCFSSLLQTITENLGEGDPSQPRNLHLALNAVRAVVASCYNVPAEEGVTEEVETIILHGVQLCLAGLEKVSGQMLVHGFTKCWDESLFEKLMMVLELIVVEGQTGDGGEFCLSLEEEMVLELPTIANSSSDFVSKCCKQEHLCDQRILEISGNIISLLASGQSVKDDHSLSILKSQTAKCNLDMQSVAQHFAVLHLRLHARLLNVCRNILECCNHASEVEGIFRSLTIFVTRILKLLTPLSSSLPYSTSLGEVLTSLIEVEALLPSFLNTACITKLDKGEVEPQECIITGLLKSFLRLVEVTTPDDSIFMNMRAFLAAIILDSLSTSKIGKDDSSQNESQHLALQLQLVSFLLQVVHEIHAHHWRGDHVQRSSVMQKEINSNLSQFQLVLPTSRVLSLLNSRSQEELMQIVFPLDGKWLDELFGLLELFHAEGMKLRPKIEISAVLCNTKDTCSNSSSSEDEALFGNLFSEACRFTSNSDGNAQGSSLEKSLNVPQNAFVQAVYDILGFLNGCIFSLSWQKNVFEAACKHFSKKHANALLQIHFSLSEFHVGLEKLDRFVSQSSADLVILVHKVNFDLLLSLVDKQMMLAEFVQEHVISEILERGYYICTLGQKSLALVAKILIHGSVQGQQKLDDHLKEELWRSFLKIVTERTENLVWACASLNDAAAGLTSLLHIEVLLMIYHSVSSSQKALIIESLVAALKHIVFSGASDLNETQFAVWSLICSRLVMATHYTATHSETFPAWLLSHLRNKFREHSREDHLIRDMEENSPLSWAAIVGKGIVGEEELPADSSYLQQLFDVNAISVSGAMMDGAKLWIHPPLEEFCDSLLILVDKWSSRSSWKVEMFIVERYVFFTVWKAVREIGSLVWPFPPEDFSFTNFMSHSSALFMRLTQCLYNLGDRESEESSKKCLSFLENAFAAVGEVSSADLSFDLTTWHFLRQGSLITLLLSLLQLGLMRITDSKTDISSSLKLTQDLQVQMMSEKLVLNILHEDSLFDEQLKLLSSILSCYLTALQKCILNVYKEQHLPEQTVNSIELLLQSGVSHGKSNELFSKLNVEFWEKVLICGASTSWKSEMLVKIPGLQDESSILDRIFYSALLHGYPACSSPGSAAVVSCQMVLETVLETLLPLLKAYNLSKKNPQSFEQSQFCQDLLSKILTITSTHLLHTIHPKCQEVIDLLVPSKEAQGKHSSLNSLRQKESLLLSICSKKEHCGAAIGELILEAIDTVNTIRSDNSKHDVLQEYFRHSGHLSVFIDVIDVCSEETVNIKVFQLLLDIIGADVTAQNFLTIELQKKFAAMDRSVLSSWLEKRLLGVLGCAEESSPESIASAGTKDMVVMLFTALVSSPSGKELRIHLVDALIAGLERAFCFFEITANRSYFRFLVQLANSQDLLVCILESSIELIEKLSNQGSCLEGIKTLLSFLNCVLNVCGFQRQQTWGKMAEGKRRSKHAALKKTTELVPAAIDPSENSATADCDATSVEEEEDEGTSDGEAMSFEKDEEEDTEKGFASRVCTFTSSGSNFMEQHWYFCYTCDLTISKGCCSICAKVCHRGHKVVYSRLSRFFCDCGAGGVRGSACLCLKPHKYLSSTSTAVSSAAASTNDSFLSLTDNQDHLPPSDSDSDLEEELSSENERLYKISLSEDEGKQLLQVLSNLDVEPRLLALCQKLMSSPNLDDLAELSQNEVDLSQDKSLAFKHEFLQLKRLYKSGLLDMKIKAEYTNSRELKSLLMGGLLVKSLLSVSSRGRLAVGEGDKVTIFEVCQLIGQPGATPVTVDKTTVKPLSRNTVRFELVHIAFNNVNESYLAVAGYEDCQVFTINPRGEVSDRLAVELALEDAYIRRIAWVPRSQVLLMVVTNKFVKLYDLSKDNLSPIHYYTLCDDVIADATLVPIGYEEHMLLMLSAQGVLFSHKIRAGKDTGACTVTNSMKLPEKFGPSKGTSIYFSAAYRLLFLSYSDGLSLVGRINKEATALIEVSSLLETEQDGKIKLAGLHHWRETFENSRFFVSFSTLKGNSVAAIHMGPVELQAQNLRMPGNSGTPRVDGIAAYRPLTKETSFLLILHDDGSLQVFSLNLTDEGFSNPSGSADCSKQSSSEEKAKKLGVALLGTRAYSSLNPVFPLDFFEKANCITQDIRLGGDILQNNDAEVVKQSLASDDNFVEGPNPTGFKIVVFNSNPDITMVGCRVHVGNTAIGHIPSELRLFQRVIKFEEGVRRWYDVPFTNAEALLADEEFTLIVGPTFNGLSLPRIDSLEVYGRSKDEFGWKEKFDAVFDLETQTSAFITGGSKHRNLYKASVQEQIIADGLKFLYGYYLSCRLQLPPDAIEGRLELSRKRCQPLLDLIFIGAKKPLLQLAAKHALHALYPVKDAYYQALDTLCLMGILHFSRLLESKIAFGGYVTLWAIRVIKSQMRSICKILVHRKSNLASFLQSNGPMVIDGLMNVFWEILRIEPLDNPTINSLVVPAVDLIYGYAECLVLNGGNDSMLTQIAVSPAVALFKKLLFAPYEAVQSSCSLAMSSRLLEVPFPKQTILAIDDTWDRLRTDSTLSDTRVTRVSDQGMIEEDGGTDTVRYCCDGCSTVPIVGRRWHCTICPDFDLCEACYETTDGDHLPLPHSREHPMSAIPIEVDLVGVGGGNDVHLSSIDDIGCDLKLQPASISMHSAFEANDCRDISAIEVKSVTMSTSTKAVNALILSRLVEETKGWARLFPGARVIPLLQLFYRLASAPSGPFSESVASEGLDLEKLVKILLEEMNLSLPFSCKSRTNFGENVILLCIFFNLVQRNWRLPGSDQPQVKSVSGSGGTNVLHGTSSSSGTAAPFSSETHEKVKHISQNERASSALCQQQLLNYLFSIIQQLTHAFKSPSRSQESNLSGSSHVACGALLNVRREFAAGSFAPYFSDSYAKAHRGDLFEDYNKLLLESAFRFAYSLVRPEKPEKLSEKEQINYKSGASVILKLDGWQEVLCSYINNPCTTSVRRFSRKLLLHLCGSKGHYYNVRDSWQLSREMKKINKLVQKSGGFEGLNTYEKRLKLVKSLSAILDVASARPQNWQKYCLRHTDILQFLLNGIFSFAEESVVHTLKLLTLAFYTGKDQSDVKSSSNNQTTSTNPSQSSEGRKKRRFPGEDTSETAMDKASLDMEASVNHFAAEEGKLMKLFVDKFLLEWNAASVRSEAKAVLYGVWHYGRPTVQVMILIFLLQRVPLLPSYGQNVAEYTDLLTSFLGKGISDSGTTSVHSYLTADVVKGIFDTLHSQNELLANHPNSRIYNTLSSLVEFDGFYLESEPCLACSCPEVPYTKMKLDSLKSETKFMDNRILVKFVGCHTIQSMTMNVHEPRRSKSVKVLNLYHNNRPVAELSQLKNNWSMWRKAKICHLAFNQTELKVDFSIPITACNFMIELDSFYENLQAASLESLQCPRCSRHVTDKHGICSNCHENAYQCNQCRNINYENLDSFLCNECGYSKYGRFEFTFMAKPSFHYDSMENDDDMKKWLAVIETESENAHKKYQQLLGFKKPLLKLISSIGEAEMDSQQKDSSVQQMIVSLPGSSSFKINRKIAILGVLYGEKCKTAFDSLSRSVQTLQGLRQVLTTYLQQKRSTGKVLPSEKLLRPSNRCYGCADNFVGHSLEWLQVLAKIPHCKQQLISLGILSELFENNIHQGAKSARLQARSTLCALTQSDAAAVSQLNNLIKHKAMYCLEHHRSIDVAASVREELQLLLETCALTDDFWEARLKLVFQLLFSSIKVGARNPAVAEYIILPCLKIISHACTPPKSEGMSEPSVDASFSAPRDESRPEESSQNSTNQQRSSNLGAIKGNSRTEKQARRQEVPLVNYTEWKNGSTYVDFIRRQYTVSQSTKPVLQKPRRDSRRADYLALKYILRWKRRACKVSVTNELAAFEEASWVLELVLSACSPGIRLEVCGLIGMLCDQSPSRRFKFLNLLMSLLPSTPAAGESAAEYFDLLYKMIESEDARLYLTARGFLSSLCGLISKEVNRIEAQEHSFHTDISQGYTLNKFIELLAKFLQISNIRMRFMKEELLTEVLEALLVIKSLIVQKTKLIGDCGRLLRELLDSLLAENDENKRHFIRACIQGLQARAENKNDRTFLFVLEQLCGIICPTKPEPVYLMILNKAHTQEEFIRGSMTKNPYSSSEIGLLMRDVKNKICHQLDLLGLVEDDYGMELLVAGNIISLDLSIAQVFEQVWRKAQSQGSSSTTVSGLLPSSGAGGGGECPPMAITYRLQGLDGEATEPMIKELEDNREESQDPEVEFAIAGAMREYGGLKITIEMIQTLKDEEFKLNQEEMGLALKLLMYCCKIRDNRQSLLQLGALGVLLETARRAFSTDAAELAEGLLLIVENLATEAIENDISVAESSPMVGDRAGEQAANAMLMFLERLSHDSGSNNNSKQKRNHEMVARILPYLTYGEQAAMEVLVNHFYPYLHDWHEFEQLQKKHAGNPKDDGLAREAAQHLLAVENFVVVAESIRNNAYGEMLKCLILKKEIPTVAIRYLKGTFSVFEEGTGFKSTNEWAQGLESAAVPMILSMLRGLCKGHHLTQKCLEDEGVLPLLHALEGASSINDIGVRAENLLDILADKDGKGEGYLAEKVKTLRNATRDEMRRRALRKREELLQGLGMRRELTVDGGERIVVSKSFEGLEDVEEEEAGVACVVCREGYSLRPAEMLGTYCYCKHVNLGVGTNLVRAEGVYTTVTHFNVIHFQCHQEAKRADASLKNPKREWDGATLRNNETLCNNIFPLRGPSVPLAQYARCVDQYWDNLNSLGRADGSRFRLLSYDIVLMLARFATGASFSTDSKGGGKESNSRLLPFMLQMGRYLLEQAGGRCAPLKALATFLLSPSSSEDSTLSQRVGAVDETVQFMMVQSLFLDSFDAWQQHRQMFLQRSMCHSYMQYKHGQTSVPDIAAENSKASSTSISGDQLFAIVKPMLIYTGLVDQLQCYCKRGNIEKGSKEASNLIVEQKQEESSSSSGHESLEPWEVIMTEKLRDIRGMLGFSKELLEWLDEMQEADDFQAAFDIMDVLQDVLSSGFQSCEDFARDAITSVANR